MRTRPKLVGCTNFKLRQLMRRVAQHYETELSRSALKATQYSLLSNLARLGALRPTDLAAALKMSTSTMSRNLRPLIAAGWITLSAGDDARSRLVQITKAGEIKRREAERYWKVAQKKLHDQLGAKRIAALHLLIDDSLELLGAEGAMAEEETI